jgi:hypothetical protein
MASENKEKKTRNARYNADNTERVHQYGYLTNLSMYFAKNVGPNQQLEFTVTREDGTVYKAKVKKADIKALQLMLGQKIWNLRKHYKSEPRPKVNLEEILNAKEEGWVENLKGAHRPSFAAPPMLEWLKTEDFGALSPPTGKAGKQPTLTSKIPQTKEGFGLRGCYSLLFFHALRVNNYKDPKKANYFTPAMKKCFGGAMPIPYIKNDEGEKVPNNGKVKTSTIAYFLSTKYGDDKRNVKTNKPLLTEDYSDVTSSQSIINSNILREEDVPAAKMKKYMTEENVATAIREYLTANTVRDTWKNSLEAATE